MIDDIAREKFWSKVDKGQPDECWLWTGGKNESGYGFLYSMRKRVGAHRASFYMANGPFDLSMYICHKCDNPSCVNPSHLFLGTADDNNKDMWRKGRAIIPPHIGLNFTEDQIHEIRADPRSHKALGRAMGVSFSTISRIRSGKSYGHIGRKEMALASTKSPDADGGEA